MKLDSTDSCSTPIGHRRLPHGVFVSEPDVKTGAEVRMYTHANVANTDSIARKYTATKPSWSYLFVHHLKVRSISATLERDGQTFFIHKTIRYFRRREKSKSVQRKEMPTVSGLIFLQGNPSELQSYLDRTFPGRYLCKNCSTGKVAVIPDSRMRPFMGLSETDPDRIRFLLHPFRYYAQNRILLRITSGDLEGLEGYVIRIDRDRRLVMDVGGMTVAISGVHAERFEVVHDVADVQSHDAGRLCRRNLQERQALIDRWFHPVKTAQDVIVQVENIDILKTRILSELAKGSISLREALGTLFFIIEEIGYYYAPSPGDTSERLSPIFKAGTAIIREIDAIIATPSLDADTRTGFEADREQLMLSYGYMFDDVK